MMIEANIATVTILVALTIVAIAMQVYLFRSSSRHYRELSEMWSEHHTRMEEMRR